MFQVDFENLQGALKAKWEEIFARSSFLRTALDGRMTAELYAAYMGQTYHYTRHNPRNQALVVAAHEGLPHRYAAFCLKHAREELGHEDLAKSDIESLGGGFGFDPDRVVPLDSTQTLIDYLADVSSSGSPYRRLGYSYWAESCYEFIGPVIDAVASTLDLGEDQMRFFISHAEIDTKHAEEVRKVIREHCRSASDYEELKEVMVRSLELTARMFDEVADRYHATLDASEPAFVKA